MHYNVDYANLSGEAKRKKAMADVKDYIGPARYVLLAELCAYHDAEYIKNTCAIILGISGYPVSAILETFQHH